MIKNYKLRITDYGLQSRRGFTLVEMLVVVGIFSLIMVAVTGIILSGLRLERRVTGGNQAVEDARRDIQGLVRLVRFSRINYVWYVDQGINLAAPVATLAIISEQDERLFVRAGTTSCFGRTLPCLEMSIDTGRSWTPLTASGVAVDDFVFYISPSQNPFVKNANGEFINPPLQPRITIVGTFRAPGRGGRSSEDIVVPVQTTVSLRTYAR